MMGKSRTVIGISMLVICTLAIAALPAAMATTGTDRSNAPCDGCHTGGDDDSIVQLTGIPITYDPGVEYQINITMTEVDVGAKNGIVFWVTAGTISWADSNLTSNSTDAWTATPDDATSWSLNWTAPASATGDVTFNVWAVDGGGGTWQTRLTDDDTSTISEIPEFTTLLIPILGILGIVMITRVFAKKRK